jgi:hypothetical protein
VAINDNLLVHQAGQDMGCRCPLDRGPHSGGHAGARKEDAKHP